MTITRNGKTYGNPNLADPQKKYIYVASEKDGIKYRIKDNIIPLMDDFWHILWSHGKKT